MLLFEGMNQPKNIPGIYNWCDRWCERCQFTARCAVFEKDEQETTGGMKSTVDKVGKSLKDALTLLQKIADEKGIDLTDISEEDATASRKMLQEEREAKGQHPLSIMAEKYLMEGRKWLESIAVQEESESVLHEINLGIRNKLDAEEEIHAIQESLDIIRWYLFFIPTKCRRALMEKSADYWQETPENERSYNGTAKVAKIALENSLRSWATLLEKMPLQEAHLIPILAMIQQMMLILDGEFPHAQEFIRPGLDE